MSSHVIFLLPTRHFTPATIFLPVPCSKTRAYALQHNIPFLYSHHQQDSIESNPTVPQYCMPHIFCIALWLAVFGNCRECCSVPWYGNLDPSCIRNHYLESERLWITFGRNSSLPQSGRKDRSSTTLLDERPRLSPERKGCNRVQDFT